MRTEKLNRFHKDEKMAVALQKESVLCECGHKTAVVTLNKKGWAVCHWCGRRIERPRDAFKTKLKNLLKEE